MRYKTDRLILRDISEEEVYELSDYMKRNKDFLGYRLDYKEINNGYMTEAVKKLIEVAFKEYNLHRIEGNIIPTNKSSIRVVEKLGFVCEGLSTKYLKINGKWEDHMHYVILNEELE